jgi:hypothetical protein
MNQNTNNTHIATLIAKINFIHSYCKYISTIYLAIMADMLGPEVFKSKK